MFKLIFSNLVKKDRISLRLFTSTTRKYEEKPPINNLQIDTLRWKPPNTHSTLSAYSNLSKPRLSALVVLTTMVGFAVAPTTAASTLSVLAYSTVGTALCVSSANSINQWIEAPYDSQMSRTRNRVLVKWEVQPLYAFALGLCSGVLGSGILVYFVNPLTGLLGFANILIYTCIYTPMKRSSITNTHAGAIVGALPPIMGWTSVTNSIDPSSLLLGLILYAWQFPHFNALSWSLRKDYSKAGYMMTSVVNPDLCKKMAVQYSMVLVPVCWACYGVGMTSVGFLATSTVVNFVLVYYAKRFYEEGSEKSARELFFGSLVHLPVLLGVLIFFKKNNLDFGRQDEEEEKKI